MTEEEIDDIMDSDQQNQVFAQSVSGSDFSQVMHEWLITETFSC